MDGLALVGRDREIEALDAALRCVVRGERAVLLLSGEPGIGKTRLLEELAQRVTRAHGTVAWGRMWEVGLTPSFWPWIQVLGALETPGDRAPVLGSLEEHTDARARLARFGEVSAFLGRRAADAPLALLLDDLHAADLSSLQLLEYLLPALAGRRVLMALATRDTDGTCESRAALARLQRGAERLPLARLGRAEVQALVRDRADAGRVFELSEGNPLFVEELLASQQSRGRLALPALSSVRAVIRERVARLPEGARSGLVAGAIVGREFRGRIVAAMLGVEDVEALVKPALELQMLAVTAPDRFRFSHALIAEAITDELSQSENARLHLLAAQALERLDASDSSAIAHHLLAAGHLAAEAAVGAAERAAQQCMAQLAFEDGAALLERALAALPLAAPNDRRRRASLLCARAEALQHAAQHAAAAALCDEAAAILRALDDGPTLQDDRELFARIALARGLEFRFGRTDPLLVALLYEALERLGEGPAALRAKLLARLAAAEQPAPDPRGPVGRALEAIELAGRLPARDKLAVMYVATAALVDYVEAVELERIHSEVSALARGTDRWISVHTRLRLCFTALERIDRRAFDAAVQVFAAEARALGLPQWTRHVHMLEAMTALFEGRFADAERAAAESEAISAALGDFGAAWMMDVHRAMAGWIRTAPVDSGVRARTGNYPPGRAAISAWFGTQDGAREVTERALAELGDRLPTDPDLATMVGSAVAFVRNRELAKRVYDLLEPRSGRIVLASMVGSAIMDLYDRVLLVLAAAMERWDVIEAHAARALAIADKLGSPVWAARVRADFADALEGRARPGDEARAAALRAQALEAAERLEMPGLAARCQVRRAPALEQAPRPAHPPAKRVELERRGELWSVTGFGERVHVKDSRGLQMIARLVEEPENPLHVLDLAGTSAGADAGDAGPALDAKARAEYRARLTELIARRDEAESAGDRGWVERANTEIEMLSRELERAFGLGGRERKVGAASERARSNVQRRIAHGIEQIGAASARIGEHLAATIRTGTYCVYEPRSERNSGRTY